MANNHLTPNMLLTVPTPLAEVGPDYAQDVSDALDKIDAHAHTGDGDGVQLGSAALNVDADISFNQSHNITDLRSARFTDQSADLVGLGDVRCLYTVGSDLFFNNGGGTAIQITAGSIVDSTGSNIVLQYSAVSSNFTVVPSNLSIYFAVNTSVARTFTLPGASQVSAGRQYIVADVSGTSPANPITVNPNGADTIDGQASIKIQASFGSALFVSDGVSKWSVKYSFNTSAGNVAVGSTPARTGAVSLSSNTAIKFRNAAASADLNLISSDASNNVSIGDTSVNSISLGNASVTFPAGVVPTIAMAQAGSGAGGDLTVKAAKGAAGTNNGGAVVLQGGDRGNGSAVYGGVKLNTGDGTTQLAVSTSAIKASTAIQGQGTNVASSGDIQLRNASFIAFRNAGNTADLSAVASDGSDNINLGNATGNTTVTGTSSIGLTVGAGSLSMTASTLTSTGVNLTFAAGNTSPTIKQSDNTTGSATAQNLKIQAQNATGVTSTGGDLALVSGTGTTQDGFITFKQGSATTCKLGIQNLQAQGNKTYFDFGATSGGMAAQTQLISNSYGVGSHVYFFTNAGTCHFGQNSNLDALTIDTGVHFNVSGVKFQTAVSSPTIAQDDVTTNSGTGATLTIQGQNETGSASTGGGLTLTSGTGTTVAGNLLLQTGGSTRITVTPTLITHALPLAQGSTVATQGDIRMASLGSIWFRNAANSGNVAGLQIDGSNNILLGDPTNGNTIVNATSSIQLRTGSNPVITATLTDVTIGAGLTFSTATKTTNYTLDSTAGVHDYQIFSNQSAAISFTLPAPANGRQFVITDISGTANTNHITLVRNASEKINGVAASYVYAVNSGTMRITSNGTDWFVS